MRANPLNLMLSWFLWMSNIDSALLQIFFGIKFCSATADSKTGCNVQTERAKISCCVRIDSMRLQSGNFVHGTEKKKKLMRKLWSGGNISDTFPMSTV
jgi:hypothetical protein